MTTIERLYFELGSELQACGGILDRLDYGRIRRLGTTLRSIPAVSGDPDIPPSSLQGWIASYDATLATIDLAQSSGLLALFQERTDVIQSALSVESLPLIDALIVGEVPLNEMVLAARRSDRVKRFDYERERHRAPSRQELAEHLVVQLDVSILWAERPSIDAKAGMSRLKIGAMLGKVALGGALTVGNLSLGVAAGIFNTIDKSSLPLVCGLVTSAFTGISASLDALDKLAVEIKK